MRVETLPSGTYRVRTQSGGKRYSMTFDHIPTDLEIALKLAEEVKKDSDLRDSFEYCARSYINSKTNVLSPSTIKGYTSILEKGISDDFKKLKIKDMTQIDIQLEINRYAEKHTPKTTRNVHGFISSVLGTFRPQMIINTTLPQKLAHEPICPTECDIKKILKASENTMYHIPLQLGILGMRRSEICAATIDDIEGNILHINKALVSDKNNKWIVKTTKTSAGTRDIYLPNKLIKEIKKQGCIYEGYPNSIYDALQGYCKKLGIHPIRFHDLRHFYASYAHSKGMSDADIMASGGWKSDYTMKSIYRHSMQETKKEMQKKIASSIFS